MLNIMTLPDSCKMIPSGDNEFFTSDYEEKEVFPTSSLLNLSSLSETLAAMDEQILGELNLSKVI